MKNFTRNFTLTITAVKTGKVQEFTSFEKASESTGISVYMLKTIARGKHGNLVRGVNNILFQVDYARNVVASLTPAWETEITTQTFCSHYAAIKFLGCGKTAYYNRTRMQEIGTPCDMCINDQFGQPWILTVFEKADKFEPNKKKEEEE